jgi:hypothetical protein
MIRTVKIDGDFRSTTLSGFIAMILVRIAIRITSIKDADFWYGEFD